MTRSVLIHLAILRTDRNLMTSTRDYVNDAWGHMLQSSPVWKCYDVLRNNEKCAMSNGWFIFNSRFSDLRADLRITAHVCGAQALRFHGHRSWSWPLYEHLFIKQNIIFGHISLLNSINGGFTPFKLYLECHRLSLQLPDQANTHTKSSA